MGGAGLFPATLWRGRLPIEARVGAAVTILKSWMATPPEVAIILGSGLGKLSCEVADAQRMPYTRLPGFPARVIAGHAGELVAGRLAGKGAVVLAGRPHYYQGYAPEELTLPVQAVAGLGCKILVVASAAGSLDPALRPGELMLIADHIDLPGLAGHSALRGVPSGFVALAGAYDAQLRALTRKIASEQGLDLKEGVYVMVSGPAYETAAETAFLRGLGAHAVGMSTVPEVVAARQVGLRVLGIAHIANRAGGVISHREVLEAGEKVAERFRNLVFGLLGAL